MNWNERYHQFSLYIYRSIGFIISNAIFFYIFFQININISNPFLLEYILVLQVFLYIIFILLLTILISGLLEKFYYREFIETPRSAFFANGDFYNPSSRSESGSNDDNLIFQKSKQKKMRLFYFSSKEKSNV
jgi:hypothetical protein